MGLSFWLQMALAVLVGIVGLLQASAGQGDPGGAIGFLVFLAAIAYGFYLLKSVFDRIDRTRH
ncbi:MAG: hypothetical protein M0002_09945 [Rhodospirillales bacterium]|nr:hypothetical protein [Rhodospirillales bacterium]